MAKELQIRCSGRSLPPHLPPPDDLLAGAMYQPVCLSGMLHQPLLPHLPLPPGHCPPPPGSSWPAVQYSLPGLLLYSTSWHLSTPLTSLKTTPRHATQDFSKTSWHDGSMALSLRHPHQVIQIGRVRSQCVTRSFYFIVTLFLDFTALWPLCKSGNLKKGGK